MISRRRKKPPDRTTFSLQSIPCLSHRPPFVLLSSSIYHLPQNFASGQHFRLICGSQRIFARSRDGILVDFRGWLCNRHWVTTTLAFDCSYTILYCTPSWPTPCGRRSCAACLGPQAWTTICPFLGMSCRRTT